MCPNVTIDPMAQTPAVAKPDVPLIRSTKSGLIIPATKLIRRLRYQKYVLVRQYLRKNRLVAGSPRYICPLCCGGLYLASSKDKAAYFRHSPNEGRACTLRKKSLSQKDIRALKYRGAQESQAHRRAKEMILSSLEADHEFSDIKTETVWRGTIDPASLRRPDVSALWRGIRIAFEVQLSTTFLDVVLERTAFYRHEGGLLVWILPFFNPHHRRMTDDDILFSNNSNVLVVDAETVIESQKRCRLTLKCWIANRIFDTHQCRSTDWQLSTAEWRDLTIDQESQKVFLIDVDANEKQRSAETKKAILRKAWLRHFSQSRDGKSYYVEQARLLSESRGAGIPMPGGASENFEVRCTVRGILSLKAGKPVGYAFSSLVEIAHHLLEKCPPALLLFCRVAREVDRMEQIANADKSGKWKRKAERLRNLLDSDPAKFLLKSEDHAFVCFLFPELASFMDRTRLAVASKITC